MNIRNSGVKLNEERGAVLVLVGLSLFVFMSFFALSVDLGYIFVTKGELQNTSDSATLAAVVEIPIGEDEARQKAVDFGQAHSVAGAPIIVDPADVVFGHYDISARTFQSGALPTNAVQVEAKRTEGSPSGAIGLFFARIFGNNTSNVSALSMAVLDPRVVGVSGKNRLIPYSVRDGLVDQDGDGEYDIGSTIRAPIENDTAGNFGYLDFDGGSNDIGELRDYIENGYDADFIIPIGGSVEVQGSPGVDGAAITPSFNVILGEIVFIPIHDSVFDVGANAYFNVISLLAVRITKIKLTGSLHTRFFEMEIIEYASSVLVVDPDAPDNNSVAKPRLVV